MPAIRRMMAAGVLTAGVMMSVAPAALAGPPPEPDPNPAPAPTASADGDTAGCADGQVMQDGNCVPAMSSVPDTDGGGPEESTPLRYGDDQSSTSTTGIGADLVPNINGTPCTGYWASMACEAQGEADLPAVQPRSTLSDSP